MSLANGDFLLCPLQGNRMTTQLDEVSKRKRFPTKLFIFLIFLLVVILFIQNNHRLIWAWIKPTWSFSPTENDAHVLYEPGVRDLAEDIAKSRVDSARKIEREQYRPFKTPVFIYVCRDPQSFDEFTTLTDAMGAAVSGDRIFVNPMVANKGHKERMDYVTHELSHAHLQQYTGLLASRLSPNWFKEGLAVLVSDGAGAGMVSDDEAIEFIRSGRTFEPTEDGSDVSALTSPRFGDLKPFPKPYHMLYHQWMMFVSYLKRQDPDKFKQLLEAFESSGDFRKSFADTYNQSIQSMFNKFVDDVRADRAGAHAKR
jgi:hypothetical protein